ncbi:SusC/RagA family TonB-linked outer membrane protein [Myroides indicus]|uniref:TonB-linked SusC/RagA family outer membrane protein n=1 Tax=Myroides indicus TaxID=1323422 RepID=A0A4R7F2G9_9FLAO|nr:SusC/RagA family TonB-linked outer membrane protein [Myroides indicus]TDS63650.1 TonB-linked SusC/RagA family outer membrane protein [Myroides indicus]
MKNTIVFVLVLLCYGLGFAQIKRTGVVKDAATGEPLIGVTITLTGTTYGTMTDIDGGFVIEAEDGQILELSYIGYTTQQLKIGTQTNFAVNMLETSSGLDEVVITALGIKKEKQALGYAVQDLSGKALEKVKESNAVSSLTGKVAGLNIKNSSDLFQNPEISLRGASPLIVIDGIPDRTADIWRVNSDDIENISVLKGATASALYGSVGRSGAIMITTKKGKEGKLTVSFNNSTMFQTSFLRKPERQTVYGNGNQGVYAYIDGTGGGTEGGGWIWGPRLDQKDPSTASGYFETPQYNSEIDPATGKLIPLPFISRGKNNVENFFRTGVIQANNVAVDWGNDKASYRVSISNQYQKGIVPNTDLNNTSFSIGGQLTPTDKLRISANYTYNKQFTDNFPEVGYGPTNYLYNLLLWTGTDVDIRDLKNYWMPGKEGVQQRHYNISYYNNPYFQAFEYMRGYDKNNSFGNYNLEYEFYDGISFKSTGGINYYGLNRTYKEPKSYIGYGDKSRGNYTVMNENFFDITTDFGIKVNKELTDLLQLSGEVAYSRYRRNWNKLTSATDGLNIPGFYNLDNNAGPSIISSNREEKEGINSFYGFVDLSYDSTYYLSLTARNDKVSTLPKGNNSFFYPSIASSVVISNLVRMPQWIDFAKVRGSWARVSEGRIGENPYSHIQGYEKGITWDGVPSAYFGNSLLSSDLKPETSDTWEVGAYVRFFKNRLGIDLTYYQTNDFNNLIYMPVSSATGYENTLVNGDRFKRKGFELVLDFTPVRNEVWEWVSTVNMSKYNKYLTELSNDRTQTDKYIKEGERTDGIYISQYQTDGQGNIVFENGYPVVDPYSRFIGYEDPDWTFGWTNTINYKDFSLSFTLDGRIGGVMFSQTNQKMWWGGVDPGTVNQYRDDANEGKATYIASGVKVVSGELRYDSNGNIVFDNRVFAPNDVPVNYNSYMQTTSNNSEKNYHYYKQDFIKLRDIALTYQLKPSVLSRTPFSSLSVSLIGSNLWMASKIKNVDPDSGKDALQTPTMKSIGFNINAKF